MRGRTSAALIPSAVLSLAVLCSTHVSASEIESREPAALKPLIDAVGGAARLRDLRTMTIESTGSRWDLDQTLTPDEKDPVADGFKQRIYYDRANDRMRIEVTRTREGVDAPHSATYILDETVGAASGQVSRFGPPGTQALSSDRWAALRREQIFLNPLLLLPKAIAAHALHEAPDAVIDGSARHVLIVDDQGQPVQLFINSATGNIDRLEARVTDPLRRDVTVAVSYADWTAVRGMPVPRSVSMTYDGHLIQEERRSLIQVNAAQAATLFELPAGVSPTFNAELAEWGRKRPIAYTINEAYGNPNPGQQTALDIKQLAPQVYLVGGDGYNSLVVEQEQGVVIVEAPQHELRSAAVIEFVKKAIPGKLITHVIATHHHADHSGGLRSYAALGSIVIAHELGAKFLARIFERPSQVSPDALSKNGRAARLEPVPAQGSVTIPDSTHSIRVIPLENEGHAKDMVAVYVSGAGVVFVTDIYSPNPAAKRGGPGAIALKQWIEKNKLSDVRIIAGGHGSSIDYAAFKALPEK